MLLVVYLAGVSQAVGNGVVLFLNRVRRLRFALSLALMGAIHLVGALVTAAVSLMLADLVFGRDLAFVPTIAVIALAQAPRLLGFLTLAPYLGELLDRLLDVWALTLVLFGLHQGVGMTVAGRRADRAARLGRDARCSRFVLGRPLDLRRRRAAARPPPAGRSRSTARNLVDALKAAGPRRDDRRTATDDRHRRSTSLLVGGFALVLSLALAPIELLGWWAGWLGPERRSERRRPPAADADAPPPACFVVFLSGIGSISGDELLPRRDRLPRPAAGRAARGAHRPRRLPLCAVGPPARHRPAGLHLALAPRARLAAERHPAGCRRS